MVTKLIRNFIWEDTLLPCIALQHLYQKTEEGGLNLLDITFRNEAIEIIWLKSYLNISLTRPKWAKITDTLIDAVAPQGSNAPIRINMFLQIWKVNTREMHHQKIHDDTTRILNVVKN